MNYYVYGLFVPGCDVPFYIGKGTRRRFRAHIKSYVYDNENVRHNRAMYDMIKEMVESGNSPETRRLAEFDSEDVALDEEYRLINHYGIISEGGILYNIHKTRGGRTGPRHRVITGDELRRRREGFKKKRAIVPTKEELEDLYFTKDMTRRQIADHYDVSQSLVGKLFVEFGIKGKTYNISEEHRAAVKRGALKRTKLTYTKEQWAAMLDEHRTANRIAKHLGVMQNAVCVHLKRHGLFVDKTKTLREAPVSEVVSLVEKYGTEEDSRLPWC